MDAGTQAIYDKIREVAKSRDITYYAEIAPLAGLNLASPGDIARLSSILGDISTAEHRDGRPLLSAVVIRKEENSPGQGFFGLAQALGLHNGDDNFAFWVQELQRVHDYWGWE